MLVLGKLGRRELQFENVKGRYGIRPGKELPHLTTLRRSLVTFVLLQSCVDSGLSAVKILPEIGFYDARRHKGSESRKCHFSTYSYGKSGEQPNLLR